MEVVNGAPSFALRMAHLVFSKPAALATGLGTMAANDWLWYSPPVCQVPLGQTTWVMKFDLAAGTLTTGAAMDPGGSAPGLEFTSTAVTNGNTSATIMPVTAPFALGNDCALDVTVGDVNMPLPENEGLYMPFRKVRFSGGKITPDHNCIGTYADDKLSPDSACTAPQGASPYTNEAEIHAMLSLEEADTIPIQILGISLCVFLTHNKNTGGLPNPPLCPRGPDNKIIFQGDHCSATNGPATPDCADALEVVGTFAASGVKLAD
jgi:hypothetical protein